MASVTSLLRSIAARLSVVGGAPGIDNLRFRKFPVCMPGCKRLSKISLIHVFIFRVLTGRGWSWVSRNEKGSLKVDRGELIICLPPTFCQHWTNGAIMRDQKGPHQLRFSACESKGQRHRTSQGIRTEIPSHTEGLKTRRWAKFGNWTVGRLPYGDCSCAPCNPIGQQELESTI